MDLLYAFIIVLVIIVIAVVAWHLLNKKAAKAAAASDSGSGSGGSITDVATARAVALGVPYGYLSGPDTAAAAAAGLCPSAVDPYAAIEMRTSADLAGKYYTPDQIKALLNGGSA